ncbi:MAG TPA: Xaa-Pro peptidase family protein, partial [Verrucomicrobiae bacterium]|nr:Xaa-Pro peptidase family protein [Verrucomicrobiae bacterium]
VSLSQYLQKFRRAGRKKAGLAEVIAHLAKQHKLKRFTVPASFPLGLAKQLRDKGIKLKPRKGAFFPERHIKSADEVKKISAALMMAEVGLAEGIQALKRSRIGKNRKLYHHNLPLTSEKLRSIIDVAIIEAGGIPGHTIVAGGEQACDPHERGHGELRANEPIILDIFPRSQKTGYFGDITRTVVRGQASEAARKLYDTVARGQEMAFSQLRHEAKGAEVHATVQTYFEEQGYKTGRQDGHMQGFFHGTGHGLGLEIHESPRLSSTSDDILQAGQVVTVEPGLYYPGIGGVRIEDSVLVTNNGARNLTKFEKVFEV